jgi:hypothetical protein
MKYGLLPVVEKLQFSSMKELVQFPDKVVLERLLLPIV